MGGKKLMNKLKEQHIISLGFADEASPINILDEIHVVYNPSTRKVGEITYNFGQRIYFRIRNDGDQKIFAPLCFVRFSLDFRHLDTNHPESQRWTINSDIWGIGGASTQLKEVSPDELEISGFLGRELKPRDIKTFFIRFNIREKYKPLDKKSFKITMTFRGLVAGEEIDPITKCHIA